MQEIAGTRKTAHLPPQTFYTENKLSCISQFNRDFSILSNVVLTNESMNPLKLKRSI